MILLLFLGNLGVGSMKMEEEIEVTGRIYVMGNEPFTQLGIELDNGKVYVLVGEHDRELRSLQGKRLTIKGRLTGKASRGAEAMKVSSFKVVESR